MELVIFGDFNCPFSALASARADRLEATGAVSVDFRAVEHEPELPPEGAPVTGERASHLAHELDRIHGSVRPDEVFALRLPAVLPNTAAMIAEYAATAPDLRPILRRRWFRAIWHGGRSTANAAPLAGDGPGGPPSAVPAVRWRTEWRSLGTEVVPVLVLPDGTVHPGLDALDWLAAAWPPPGAAAGGEGPCLIPHVAARDLSLRRLGLSDLDA